MDSKQVHSLTLHIYKVYIFTRLFRIVDLVDLAKLYITQPTVSIYFIHFISHQLTLNRQNKGKSSQITVSNGCYTLDSTLQIGRKRQNVALTPHPKSGDVSNST